MDTIVDDEKREVYPCINSYDWTILTARLKLVFLYKLVEGAASSSFGTHVANLAGVPRNVIERAENISKDFADQFQKKMVSRRTSTLPLSVQADVAFLIKLASGALVLGDDKTKQKEVLRIVKKAASHFIQ